MAHLFFQIACLKYEPNEKTTAAARFDNAMP